MEPGSIYLIAINTKLLGSYDSINRELIWLQVDSVGVTCL